MFGFLPGPCGCASRDEHSAWRSHFCGLCNTLRARYGLWSRWLINRDSTFLALTGSALAADGPEVTLTTCCNPLGRKRPLVQHQAPAQFAAAVTICGLAVKLRDDAGDERGLRRRAARTGGWMLRGAEGKARADLLAAGFPVGGIVPVIESQTAVESSGASLTAAVEPVARTYGAIFGHLAQVAAAPSGQAALADAGAALGRMIYTVDAWEDYEKDLRRRRFNPLPCSESSRQEMVAEAVEKDLGILSRALSALPFRRYGSLITGLAGPLLRQRTLTRLGMAGPPPLPPEWPPSAPPDQSPGGGWPDESQREGRKRRRGQSSPEKKSPGCCAWTAGCGEGCCGCGGKRKGRRRDHCCDCCVLPCDCGDCGDCGCPCDC